jgi:NADH-quinone oxidoreductase subunit G
MPTLEIDGQEVTVEDGVNLIAAAGELGIEIPHYCYHPGLTVAGNCRMCLVEIERMPKLQIACNTKATDGMVVKTKSEKVENARGAVLEFLLINHPVDCPICDQAGECKLQDYYMDYDRQESRVPLQSKVRKGKATDIGPLIMLDQERCILCTRCTRFLDEVTKTSELGVFERGNHCEIDIFPDRRLDNPYSGNVADICPVGALTNKDFRFRARVWYLESTASVCPSCATGCNIDIHHRRGEIFRFRPRQNADVNQYWMCDEGRLSYKAFQGEGRLLEPVTRDGDAWKIADWDTVAATVRDRLAEISSQHGAQSIAGVVSAQATNEEVFLFRRWLDSLGGRAAAVSYSPADASSDDFLISADKNPNTAGLKQAGLDPGSGAALIDAATRGGVRALVLLRTDLAALCSQADLEQLGEKLDFVVVIDTHYRAGAEIADLLLPIGSFAETDGTFTNRDNRVQLLRCAEAPAGGSRAGWEVLGKLSSPASAAAPPASASTVFDEIAASNPSFAGLSHERLGALGAPAGAE